MTTPKKIIIKDLELADEEITRLRKENKRQKDDNKLLIETNERLKERNRELFDENKELKEENMNLNEFKVKREESMFYFKSLMERAEPKTAREAEDLYRAKEIFEGLYRQELYCLEKENKELKKKLEHYENTKAIQKSNDASRWKP